MDTELFLQTLRDLSLEEGKVYIQEHVDELSDHAAIGNSLADEALRLLYSPFVSLKLAELLIYFGECVQHTSSHALGLKAKGDALRYIGHHQAAIECLDAAGDEFLGLGDVGNWARSRISWITANAWLGRIEEALQEGNRARDSFVHLGAYYWVCIVDSNMAIIYALSGRYHDALNIFERMLAIYPTITDQDEIFITRAIAIAEVNQAEILSWLGRFEEAYRLFQLAQTRFMSLDETSMIIYSETHLADLDYKQGYYGSALRRYYKARDIVLHNDVDNPTLLAELKLWMANCLVKLNRAQEACQLAAEAVEILRQLDISLDTGDALLEHASTLIASDRSADALLALDEAWKLFTRGGFDRQAFATKLQQAELLLDRSSFAEAYEQARVVKEYSEIQGFVSLSARASLVMAGSLIGSLQQNEVLQKKQILQEAVSLCKHIALQARRHNLHEEVYKSQYLLGLLFAFQGDAKKAERYYRYAIDQIEDILNDLVYDLSPSFLHTTWVVYENMITLCLQENQVERAFGYLERARSMALRQYLNKSSSLQLKREIQEDETAPSGIQKNDAMVLRTRYELKEWQERYRDYCTLLVDIDPSVSPSIDQAVIEAELKRCESKISELFERLHLQQSDSNLTFHAKKVSKRKVQHIDVAQIRRYLSPNQLLLAYFLHQDSLVIFALTAERLVVNENPNGVAELEYLLPVLHAHLQPAGWPDPKQPPQQIVRRLLNKLYSLLIAPVVELLPTQTGHLTIVPYGPLHELPFHALHNGSRFLIEDFQINYLPASSVLQYLGACGHELKESSRGSSAFANHPLVFGYSGNGHLKHALDESRIVAELLGGQCYLENEATISRLIELAPGSPIIHLATHGKSRLDAPNFSYVRLADGQLNAIDAFNLNLEECELVTLSGCETGLALSGGGDEQLGLGRAFLAAGANSLVMSLWPVEDQATNELMQLFYQNLLHGDTRVNALREAQCNFLCQSSSVYTHPYFWAAFRLVGEVGPLKNFRV